MLQSLQLSAHFVGILSADVLQMSDGGIWGNPLGFEEEAMQVQSILAPSEHHETGNCKMNLPLLRDSTVLTWLFLSFYSSRRNGDCDFFQPHGKPVSVFTPTASLQAAAPKMSGQIIRSLIGKLERMFSSQKPGSV